MGVVKGIGPERKGKREGEGETDRQTEMDNETVRARNGGITRKSLSHGSTRTLGYPTPSIRQPLFQKRLYLLLSFSLSHILLFSSLPVVLQQLFVLARLYCFCVEDWSLHFSVFLIGECESLFSCLQDTVHATEGTTTLVEKEIHSSRARPACCLKAIRFIILNGSRTSSPWSRDHELMIREYDSQII